MHFSVHVSLYIHTYKLLSLCNTIASYCSTANIGARLWSQQYCGLLLKKILNTVRFWHIFVATYLIPILACLIGLLCFRLLSQFAPLDPPRALRIDNSGTDPNHQVLFWAKFGEFSNSFDFEVREECTFVCIP